MGRTSPYDCDPNGLESLSDQFFNPTPSSPLPPRVSTLAQPSPHLWHQAQPARLPSLSMLSPKPPDPVSTLFEGLNPRGIYPLTRGPLPLAASQLGPGKWHCTPWFQAIAPTCLPLSPPPAKHPLPYWGVDSTLGTKPSLWVQRGLLPSTRRVLTLLSKGWHPVQRF